MILEESDGTWMIPGVLFFAKNKGIHTNPKSRKRKHLTFNAIGNKCSAYKTGYGGSCGIAGHALVTVTWPVREA